MSGKRIKLPKRIAGVKIPKSVRKGPVADFLNSSDGQALLAEMLTLAGGAFALRDGEEGSAPRETTRQATARLAHAVGEAARAFRAAMADESFRAPVDSDDVADAPEIEDADANDERARRAAAEGASPEVAR